MLKSIIIIIGMNENELTEKSKRYCNNALYKVI